MKRVECTFFFFSSRRRHTRYWRDWSSDVCSSDLVKRLKKSIARLIAALEKELAELDDDIDDAVRSSPVWREKEDLLASVPGVGDVTRSEERRVGKECRSRWSPYH